MRIACIHCGKAVSIRAEQLGGQWFCPHCQGEILLPDADEEQDPGPPPWMWVKNWISALASLAIHLVLFLLLALITYRTGGGLGPGEEVRIGKLPVAQLQEADPQETASLAPEPSPSVNLSDELSVEESLPVTAVDPELEQALRAPPAVGGNMEGAFDLGSMSIAGDAGGGSWEGMLQTLRRDGLDIVLTFDSTGSMHGEIDQVKSQIRRIGRTLLQLVPKARISLCTYRDELDEYVARGIPLTSDLGQLERFLAGVRASGGGDYPEAVHKGLRWAVENNQFRPRARKVILLFGDAPPHREFLRECLEIAADFRDYQRGVVSTVTCRNNQRLPELVQIARVGGGEAFLTSDERQIMTQLMVLVFGSRYRDKVLEAFELMENP